VAARRPCPPKAGETSTPSASTLSTSAAPVITLTDAERVTKAEAAVQAVLPNAPIWKGMTGHVVGHPATQSSMVHA
jgi:hypothetical protein